VRSEYGFHHIEKNGRTKLWRPGAGKIFGTHFVPWDEDDTYQGAIIVAERLEFLRGEPEITHDPDGCRILNLWRPPPWVEDASAPEPEPFVEHLRYLFDHDDRAIEHVLNFLAHLLQRPQERVSHALLITSEAKGIGKSTLGTIVRRLVGEQNSRIAQTKDLKSSFDGWLVGKLVVQVDEIYEAGNWGRQQTEATNHRADAIAANSRVMEFWNLVVTSSSPTFAGRDATRSRL
jgi:Family of unknown function (DUF5906)